MDRIELLSPAGSIESLRAAVQNGADAVYMGGAMFNARRNAKNFDDAQMERAIAYCRLRGVKTYITMNTLLFDRELEDINIDEFPDIETDDFLTAADLFFDNMFAAVMVQNRTEEAINKVDTTMYKIESILHRLY